MLNSKDRRPLLIAFGVSEALLLGAALWTYFALRYIQEPLILHFSPYTGINQIGRIGDLIGVALTGMVLVGINAVLAFSLESRHPIFARLFAYTTLFIAILLFMAFMAIISANS